MGHSGVNRFDGLILLYVLTTRTKMWMMQKSFNGIDRISFRANVKRFTQKTKKKDNIMSIVRQCKE